MGHVELTARWEAKSLHKGNAIKKMTLIVIGKISIAIGVSMQVYATSNILMSTHIISTRIDVIIFAITILIEQLYSKLK